MLRRVTIIPKVILISFFLFKIDSEKVIIIVQTIDICVFSNWEKGIITPGVDYWSFFFNILRYLSVLGENLINIFLALWRGYKFVSITLSWPLKKKENMFEWQIPDSLISRIFIQGKKKKLGNISC